MSGFADCNADPAILARARRGDMKAHEVLYRMYGTAVYTLAVRMLKDRSMADEVLQETSIEVIRKLPTVRDDAAFAGWIKRIAVNKCLGILRSAWHRLAVNDYRREEDGSRPAAMRPSELSRSEGAYRPLGVPPGGWTAPWTCLRPWKASRTRRG